MIYVAVPFIVCPGLSSSESLTQLEENGATLASTVFQFLEQMSPLARATEGCEFALITACCRGGLKVVHKAA